jgi:GT2 family glycosyltransferase
MNSRSPTSTVPASCLPLMTRPLIAEQCIRSDRCRATGAGLPPRVGYAAVDRLSVVMSVHNRARDLARCLQSLAPQDAEIHERIVVDDGSADDTAAVAREAGCTVLRLATRRGICAARNPGAARATGEVIAFIDDDTMVLTGWAAGLRAAFADGAAIVGGEILQPEPRSLAEFYRVGARCHDQQGRNGFLPFVCGANLAIRRDVFCQLGGFDETLPASEDLDLSFRAQLAGHDVRFVSAAALIHRPRDSVRGLLAQERKYAHGDRVAEAKYLAFPFQQMKRWHRTPARVLAVATAGQLMAGIDGDHRRLAFPLLSAAVVVAREVGAMQAEFEFLTGRRTRPTPIECASPQRRDTASPLPGAPTVLLLGDDPLVATMLRITCEATSDVAVAPPGLEREALARWEEAAPQSPGLVRAASQAGWRVPRHLTALRLERERPRTWGDAFVTLHRIHAWLHRRQRFGVLAVGQDTRLLSQRFADVPIVAVGDHLGDSDRVVLKIKRRELLRDRRRVVAALAGALEDAA